MDERGKKVFDIKQGAVEKDVSAKAVIGVLDVLTLSYGFPKTETEKLKEYTLEAVASSEITGLREEDRASFIEKISEVVKNSLANSTMEKTAVEEFIRYFRSMLENDFTLY